MRWQAPQASAPACPFCTMDGAGGCSSGNQSGGFNRSSICAGVYVLVLPATLFGPGSSAGTAPLIAGNAQDGSRPGAAGCWPLMERTDTNAPTSTQKKFL